MGWGKEKAWIGSWISSTKEKINGGEIELIESPGAAEENREEKRGNLREHKKKKSWTLKASANRERNAEEVRILEREVEDVPKNVK